MKSKPVIQLILPITALGILLFARAASIARASPFPQRGYTLSIDGEGLVRSSIGRRASVDSAQRSQFVVDWETLNKNGESREDDAFFNYYAATDGADLSAQSVSLMNKRYLGVTKTILHATARHNGTFKDLTRGDVVDYLHPVHIDLGTRASYKDGSRAAMRVLAQRLRSPFHSLYEFAWRYHRADVDPDRRMGEATVFYDPTGERNISVHQDASGSSSVSWAHDADKSRQFKGAGKKAIFAVAHRSGTIENLTRFGTEMYRIPN